MTTDQELIQALLDLQTDALDPAVPNDVLNAMVLAEGGDPDALARSTTAFVEAEAERHRLAWRDEAKKRAERLREKALAGRRARDGMTTLELLAEIEALKADPKLQQPIALAARKRKPGQEPDPDELRMLLEDLDKMRAMANGDNDKDR